MNSRSGRGGKFRGLQNHRTSCRQRRRQLPAHQHQRRVPWRDKGAYADRFAQDVGEMIRPISRHHRTLNLIGKPAVVVEPLRQILGLRVHLRHQLAVVAHLDLGQMLSVFFDQPGNSAHHLAACRLRHRRPWPAIEGARGRFAGTIRVDLVALGNGGPGVARIGVEGLERLAGSGIAPLAVDIGLVGLELGGPILHGGLLQGVTAAGDRGRQRLVRAPWPFKPLVAAERGPTLPLRNKTASVPT